MKRSPVLKGSKMVEDREPVLPFGSFLFPQVFRAFRMSIQPTKLILAFLALTAICVTGRVMDFNETVAVIPSGMTELDVYASAALPVENYISTFADVEERDGVFTTLWNFGARRFHLALTSLAQGDILGITQNVAACFTALLWAFRYHTLYSIIFFTVTLAVMSLAGGAICRIAALQFAQGEKPGLTEAMQFGRRKFCSFLTTPIAPVGIIAVIGAFVVLLGFIGNIPVVGELSVGLFLPLALIAAALTAVIAIGALAGFNLMFPTIAYEDSDCFDAISRSFSYVYAKPWRMGFYTVTATIYGAICYAFVRFFAFLLLWITRQFLEFGFLKHNEKLTNIWPEPNFADFLGSAAATPARWSESISAFLIYVSVLVVVGLMVSFVISFYFSANTIIYALMRNRVDKTALDEIYTGTDEMAAELAPLPAESQRPTEAKGSDEAEKPPETSE
jgi:hypothetical protein